MTSAFEKDNLAFQPKHTGEDRRIRLAISIGLVRAYAYGQRGRDGIQDALAFIEDSVPKTEPICDEIRVTFVMDEFTQSEEIQAIATQAYVKLQNRMAGIPL